MTGPIIARELLTTPRRPRHAVLRTAYIALLFVLMWTAWQAIIGFEAVRRTGDYPFFHQIVFPLLARVQLVLVLFISALYGTSALSHEKDRRTLLLLMMTRLKDREIIVDKFLCGLLQVATLLVAAAPVFFLLLLLGGVSPKQIGWVYAATFGAALLSNAVGVFIAAWRDKTFQAVAMTLLALVLAVVSVELAVGVVGPKTLVLGRPFAYLAACLSPFRAMEEAVTGDFSTLGFAPSMVFLLLGGAVAVGLLTVATMKLRSWYPINEPIMAREPEDAEVRAGAEAVTAREARYRKVTGNPVLWRERKTRAYGTRPIIIKLGYLLICAIVVAMGWNSTFGRAPEYVAARTTAQLEEGEEPEKVDRFAASRETAMTAMVVAIAVLGLMLINTQAVTAITSERDIKALDLLLATRITPPEFIFGKMLGVLFNAMEMVLAPTALLVAAAVRNQISPTAMVFSLIIFAIFVVFATLLGIHAALRYDSTRVAIAHSLGTMFLLFVGILICLFLILVSGNDRFGAQWASFLLFIVLGSIGLWVSLSANHPSNALALTASLLPFATFYCVIAYVVGDRVPPFLVGASVYSFAVAALLIPLLAEFDVATGRTTHAEG